MSKYGRLYVVATPIGNLDDVSLRALQVLRSVALVAAEDTRHSRNLLRHFDIDTPLTSYHEHNEASKSHKLIDTLLDGNDVALISDAGTPCISDPGYRVVQAAHESGIEVITIPGPSSVIAALAASGIPTDTFCFHGFFPRKQSDGKDRLQRIQEWRGATHVLFEAPNRLLATLHQLSTACPGLRVAVCRELSKIHEETITGTIEEVMERFSLREVRGECVIMIHIPDADNGADRHSDAELRARVEALILNEDMSRRDAIRRVSEDLGVPRNRVYGAAMGAEPA